METQSPTIRPARHTDMDALVSLLQALFAIEEDFSPDPDRQRKGLARFLDGCGKHRAVKLAFDKDKMIGMCTAQTRISTAQGKVSAVVEDLVVTPDYQSRGVGSRLLDSISEWAQQRGITRLSLLADKNNANGLRFYSTRNWDTTDLICLIKEL